MIDRIRLTAAAKIQLSTLKRKTGIEHYNALCRHALCLSLANASMPPEEDFNFNGGVEIDWRTFTGGYEVLYENLIVTRMIVEGVSMSDDSKRRFAISHIHRGLSFFASKSDFQLEQEIVSLV